MGAFDVATRVTVPLEFLQSLRERAERLAAKLRLQGGAYEHEARAIGREISEKIRADKEQPCKT